MKTSKHYLPNGIYIDKAGTRYTVRYMENVRTYITHRLDRNGETIPNSGCTFVRWLGGLRYIGERKVEGIGTPTVQEFAETLRNIAYSDNQSHNMYN